MNKVVLLSPPSRSINHQRPPIALMSLSGYLKRYGICAKVIDVVLEEQVRNKKFYEMSDLLLERAEENILGEVRQSDTDIIGIGCYTPEYTEVNNLARKIKGLKPEAKVIVGGVHPTLYPYDFLGKQSFFDFVVIGEGEETLLELVQCTRNNRTDLSSVPGIGYYDHAKEEIVINEGRKLRDNLDEVSYPDYDGLDMGFYVRASPYAIRGVFTRSFHILSSRGCPGRCTFCVAKKLRGHHVGRLIRQRSPGSLFNEIIYLRENFNIDSFYFMDDLFTLKKNNVHEFCDLIVEEKAPLIWGCSSRVDTVDYDMLRVMRNAGCVQIDFGVEKGSDQALRELKKGITVSQIKNAFTDCRSLGIRTFANMLINTPGETEKDLNDITVLLDEIKPTIVSVNIFTPYPGCEIYDEYCKPLGKDKHYLLSESPITLINTMPDTFRFASHSVDLGSWTLATMKKYNRFLPNTTVFFDPKYIKSVVLSNRKKDYIYRTGNLLREFALQKFS